MRKSQEHLTSRMLQWRFRLLIQETAVYKTLAPSSAFAPRAGYCDLDSLAICKGATFHRPCSIPCKSPGKQCGNCSRRACLCLKLLEYPAAVLKTTEQSRLAIWPFTLVSELSNGAPLPRSLGENSFYAPRLWASATSLACLTLCQRRRCDNAVWSISTLQE